MSSASQHPPAEPPPAYESISSRPKSTWAAQNDPRSSSTDSLTPSDDNTAEDLQHRPNPQRRRKLLCIYVHGFMGNETSFRSFPAHVHNLLAVLLSETHAVHTKIYPRYRSRRNISCARDDFSNWLTPHEGDNTDVVLLGHSMGGLVCAEVALKPCTNGSRPLQHRIVGTVNFDVPFLGMHPGVVKSGLASIFTSAEEPADKWQDTQMAADANGDGRRESDALWRPEKTDPNFNPSYGNDVIQPMRSGWKNAWHFVSKHSDNLGKATKQLVTSHMEFGGAMANYSELKSRYARLRTLEVDDPNMRRGVVDGGTPPRVRFVNYYTASTGRPKKPKDGEQNDGVGESSSLDITENRMPRKSGSSSPSERPVIQLEQHDDDRYLRANSSSQSETPAIQLEQYDDDRYLKANDSSSHSDGGRRSASPEMRLVDPTPTEEAYDTAPEESPPESSMVSRASTTVAASESSSRSSLPPIPEPPTAPSPLEVSYIEDKQTRKLVEKEHSRAMKQYEHAVKERERIIRDRAKLEEKNEKRAKKESSKAEKEAQKAREKAEKEDGKVVKKMSKVDEKRELTHSEREEMRLAEERERMEKEHRRLRGEPEPELASEPKLQPGPAPEPDAAETRTNGAGKSESAPDLGPGQTRKDGARPLDPEPVQPTIASSSSPPPETKNKKPPKDRKFCTLPPKDSQGERDPCWPRVFMKDVDEVGAHCGLFFVDERYEKLVGDVSERIEEWVREQGGIEGGMQRMRMEKS